MTSRPAGRSCSILGACAFPNCDCPASPESETPESVHAQLTRKGPNFRGRIRDVIKALRGENEKTVDRAVGHLIGCCKGEMIFRRVALKEIDQLERRLALALTEIKGHMRVEDDLQARVAELEKVLGGIANAKRFDRTIFAGDDAFADWARSIAGHALKDRA